METVLSRVEAGRPVAPEEAARADFYALLAALFHHAPDAKLLQTLSIAPPIEGGGTDLARAWIAAQPAAERTRITIYSCGPTPMLRAVQKVADEFAIPTQLCLEEFMACAVGGCAGCVVPVLVDGQRQMKRVCVDGPVFDGAAVYA